eukprot:1145033-Pelagomonas_calceolata.AAC.13
MLEIVPTGVDKWVGMQTLLGHLDVPHRALMAVGDGMNDLQLVANAGVGVAVGNAVPAVKDAAAYTASRTNHEGGVAEAFERRHMSLWAGRNACCSYASCPVLFRKSA